MLYILPQDIATAQNLLVSEYSNERAIEFDSTGANLGVFASHGSFSSGDRFEGMAFDANGYLYTAQGNVPGIVSRFSPTGTYLGTFATTGLSDATDIQFDATGNLYVASFQNNTVHRFSPAGADLGVFASVPSAYNLAFARDGSLYVDSASDNTIHHFSATGVDLGALASAGSTVPAGLAFDVNDNLYVAYRGNNTVRRFSPTGIDLGVFASGLNDPVGIAFDSGGELYVANIVGGNVRRFSPTGADLGNFATGLSLPNGLVFRPSPSAVPEPGNVAALFSVMVSGGLLLRRRHRRC